MLLQNGKGCFSASPLFALLCQPVLVTHKVYIIVTWIPTPLETFSSAAYRIVVISSQYNDVFSVVFGFVKVNEASNNGERSKAPQTQEDQVLSILERCQQLQL